jgi:hypothetical protein
MITVSGIVKDLDTGTPVSGATVYSILYTDNFLSSSGVTSSSGTFSITVPSGLVSFIPFKENYWGHAKTLEYVGGVLDLNLSSGIELPQSEGRMFTHLIDSSLVTSTNVLDSETNFDYIFAITDYGLDILDRWSLRNSGYLINSGGFSCISLDKSSSNVVDVYLGTTSGVGVLSYSGSGKQSLNDSFEILYSGLDATCISSIEDSILVGTSSGITLISGGTSYSHLTNTSTEACLLLDSGDIYYSPAESGIYCKYSPVSSDWTSPDYLLDSNSIPSILSNKVNDIEIGVPTSGNLSIFLATSSGISIYDENRSAISGSTMKSLTYELESSVDNIIDVELLEGTTINLGNVLYTSLSGTSGEVKILDLEEDIVINHFERADLESNLKRAGLIKISGSRFVEL